MGMFLNSMVPFESYKAVAAGKYFVDKSELINELIPALGAEERFFCITRPRRFGKSIMANMVGAFFEKTVNSRCVFDRLRIAESKNYLSYINKHNVVYIDFSEEPENCASYDEYIGRILDGLKQDLFACYPEIVHDKSRSVWDIMTDIFQQTRERFVFVIDEWDAVFHLKYIKDSDRQAYLRFLKNMLKGKIYVEFAYMTGILPIAKYCGGSELNMFWEYDMATKRKFSEYFGFSDTEVDRLYQIYQNTTEKGRITREELRFWYDGYHTAKGERLYNPRSVICALGCDQLSSYWTDSGPYEEVYYYIRNNVADVRDDLAFMVCGEKIDVVIEQYAATAMELNTKSQIYSAMVVYGLLTYDEEEGKMFIPNKELMNKFDELLLSNESLGYIHRLAKESKRMLKATLSGDVQTMAEILQYAHNTESPVLAYNSEIELAAVVNLVYLAARDKYRVEREDKAGKGFVDFIFYPERRCTDAIILELKVDSTPEEAVRQIKDKEYVLRLKGKLGEKTKYTGKILAVGISYDKNTKIHSCKVEILS